MTEQWTQTTTIRLPVEGQRVEWHPSTGEFGPCDGVFRSGLFFSHVRGNYHPNGVREWRPLPEPPKPRVPEFVEERLVAQQAYTITPVLRSRLASCFAWPHDPPRIGDKRLVVETCIGVDALGATTLSATTTIERHDGT